MSEIDTSAAPDRSRLLATLRPFVRRRSTEDAVERCELCSVELRPDHQHLLEPATRQITCSCDACAILFDGRPDGRFKRIPRRIDYLADFQLTDAAWDGLQIPISMAFFYQSSVAGRVVAIYPSPAGPTESLLALDAWDALVAENPILHRLAPDVEALLVSRGTGAQECFRVPIDECYRLVGIIRTYWRGLSGGDEVRVAIRHFFDDLKERAHA